MSLKLFYQIRKAGYDILVVWQLDFLKDYENEVKIIIEFALSWIIFVHKMNNGKKLKFCMIEELS